MRELGRKQCYCIYFETRNSKVNTLAKLIANEKKHFLRHYFILIESLITTHQRKLIQTLKYNLNIFIYNLNRVFR